MRHTSRRAARSHALKAASWVASWRAERLLTSWLGARGGNLVQRMLVGTALAEGVDAAIRRGAMLLVTP